MLMQFSGCGKGPREPSLLLPFFFAYSLGCLWCFQENHQPPGAGEPEPRTHGQVEAGTKPALLVEQTS